jgi:hypothetical protein
MMRSTAAFWRANSLPEPLSFVTLHPVEIREISESDWAQVWPIVREIVVAAETFAYDPSMSSSQAQDI